MRRFAFLVALALTALTALHAVAATPDYARESRWADEVLPQIVVGDPIWLAVPGKPRVLAIFTMPVGTPKGAIVVVHGSGVHPDWNLIGELRTKLAERGYATLAVQMPVLAADAARDAYRALFDDASARMQAASEWLRAKGYSSAAIVAHSLGASMADAFLTHGGTAVAWVPVGMQDDFSVPPRIPVLDVVAERDLPEVLVAVRVRAARLPRDSCSGGVTIPATDHFMNGATTALSDAIAAFLDRVYARRC